jgi:mannose-6-phosphate isomerase-like protein (cupin superfamily)
MRAALEAPDVAAYSSRTAVGNRLSVDSLSKGTNVDYIRPLDMSKFNPDQFTVQTLASRETDSQNCLFRVARMPAPRLSEEQHIHAMDKFYYVLSGRLHVEIETETSVAEPHTLIFVPARVPHRIWNEGPEPEMHIILFIPEPGPGEPLVIPVSATAP